LLKNLVSVYTHRWLLILGAVYILTIVYAPEGILGVIKRRTKELKPRAVGVQDLIEGG
jgi:branched-chain amino acid transport system permease protein